MKRRTDPQEKLRAWAENSSFPSTPSCALMLPITPRNNAATFKRSSRADTKNRDYPFPSIHEPVKSRPDEGQLPHAKDP
ncbi:MAG: hypothetical protein WB930_10530 [Syntrophobacteraceae bacterium]